MKRIYLDWGIISNLKKEENADLREFFLSHKDRFFFVYSPAHFDDLMRSEGDPRLEEDLDTLTSLVDDHLLSFDRKGVKPYREAPYQYYERRKKEPPIKLVEFGEILSSMDSISTDGRKLGTELKTALQTHPFPIPREVLSEGMWGALLPGLPDNPSVLDVIQSMGLFVDKMQEEGGYYKNYRSNIHKGGFKLENNSGNWSSKDVGLNISDFLKSKGIDKTFKGFVQMPFDGKDVSEYNMFVAEYLTLDTLGYHSDKLSKPGSTINSILSDAQHAYFASFCDCFVTCDHRLASKAKVLYSENGIDLQVMSPTEAMTVLQEEIKPYDSKYFFSFLRQQIIKENIVRRNDSPQDSVVYEFNQRLLGYFSRGILDNSSENETILQLDEGTRRSSSFLFADEVAMIVDLISDYLSAEPIRDYASIKDALVRGETNVSVIWIIRGGEIILKNSQDTRRPVLLVIEKRE